MGAEPNGRRRSRRGGGRNPDGSRRASVAEGSRPAGVVGGPSAGCRGWADVPQRGGGPPDSRYPRGAPRWAEAAGGQGGILVPAPVGDGPNEEWGVKEESRPSGRGGHAVVP